MSKAEEKAWRMFPEKLTASAAGYGYELYPFTYDMNQQARYGAVKGYEQAEKDLGWHSVDECLPEMDEEVIVLKDILVEGGLKVGFGKIAFGHIVDTERCIDYNGWNIPGVKYWMPMPKLPEEEL